MDVDRNKNFKTFIKRALKFLITENDLFTNLSAKTTVQTVKLTMLIQNNDSNKRQIQNCVSSSVHLTNVCSSHCKYICNKIRLITRKKNQFQITPGVEQEPYCLYA